MELRHLRYFVATAEELHFTRAARRLGIAQPPLTQQMKALERELGVQLFDRLPRRIAITDAGKMFLEEARFILDRVGQAVARTQQAARGLVGRVGVGFTESASFHPLVTAAFQAFRSAYPDLELSLEEARSIQLVNFLRQGRIDAAFVRPPLNLGKDIILDMIVTEAMVVAVPSGHRLASRKAVRLTDLKDEPFVLYPRATRLGLSDAIVAACERAGFDPIFAQRAPQVSSTINLVAASLGISIVPECMRQIRPEAVKYLPLAGEQPRAPLGIAYRANESSAPALNFVNLTKNGAPLRQTTPSRSV